MKFSQKMLDAIDKTLRKDVRDEAKEILSLTTNEERKNFMNAFKTNKGNICCLILDFAKKDLVEAGKMIQKDEDAFGKWFLEEN